MTALSRTGNHQHEGLVESKVKAAFDAGAVVRYKVTASGNQPAQTPTLADKTKFTKILDFDKNFNLLVNIINEEKKVATTLTCEAYTRKKVGNKWEDDKNIVSAPVTNEVATAYDSYELGDNVQPATVNLNTADEEQLSRLTAIGPGKAVKIIVYRGTTILQPPATKFFDKVEDLSKVSGIGESAIAKLKIDPLVTL
jgi:competence ComEA-like helix-hairpin-helix protein